jgi:DNA replication protein DnaC
MQTSNRGFTELGDVFGDPAVKSAPLERMHHHALVVQIKYASYCLRTHATTNPPPQQTAAAN